MIRLFSGAGLLALALSIGGAAQAESARSSDSTEVYTRDDWPDELVKRPLTLAEDLTQIDLPVVFNLTKDFVGKPVTIPLRLAYGVTDGFTLAITHQTGLCLGGTSNGCAKVYNDVGLQGLFSLVPSGIFQAALAAGAVLPSITEPFLAAARVGFDTRFGRGPIALRIDPRVQIGLNERNPPPLGLGSSVAVANRDALEVPVTLQLQAMPNLALWVGSGVFGQLNPLVGSFSDSYAIPLSFGAAYTSGDVDVGAQFAFPYVRGPVGLSGTDIRVGEVFASFRL
ncbi:MAG TPA: hypothetical protein VN874_01340 [Myxococcales bacterium]|jgi:hypothetical protein|nr:hypothetical protein [Myxococcales bacterium]